MDDVDIDDDALWADYAAEFTGGAKKGMWEKAQSLPIWDFAATLTLDQAIFIVRLDPKTFTAGDRCDSMFFNRHPLFPKSAACPMEGDCSPPIAGVYNFFESAWNAGRFLITDPELIDHHKWINYCGAGAVRYQWVGGMQELTSVKAGMVPFIPCTQKEHAPMWICRATYTYGVAGIVAYENIYEPLLPACPGTGPIGPINAVKVLGMARALVNRASPELKALKPKIGKSIHPAAVPLHYGKAMSRPVSDFDAMAAPGGLIEQLDLIPELTDTMSWRPIFAASAIDLTGAITLERTLPAYKFRSITGSISGVAYWLDYNANLKTENYLQTIARHKFVAKGSPVNLPNTLMFGPTPADVETYHVEQGCFPDALGFMITAVGDVSKGVADSYLKHFSYLTMRVCVCATPYVLVSGKVAREPNAIPTAAFVALWKKIQVLVAKQALINLTRVVRGRLPNVYMVVSCNIEKRSFSLFEETMDINYVDAEGNPKVMVESVKMPAYFRAVPVGLTDQQKLKKIRRKVADDWTAGIGIDVMAKDVPAERVAMVEGTFGWGAPFLENDSCFPPDNANPYRASFVKPVYPGKKKFVPEEEGVKPAAPRAAEGEMEFDEGELDVESSEED